MPLVELEYEPRPLQWEIHRKMSRHRYGVLVCHRRFGKTVLAVNHLQRGALTKKAPRHAPPRFALLGPTYRQEKAAAFNYMQHYAAPIPGVTVNQSELRVDYPNGGQSRIYGADNPDSLRGLYLDGVALDEFGLHPPKTYSEVISPTLIDRLGWVLFLGTPNGKNQFYEIAQYARERQQKQDPDWFYSEHKASETGLIPRSELEKAQDMMTADEYEQEYECSFAAAVKGAIYSKELGAARDEKRVGHVPVDPTIPVDTDWDLGIGDAMSIWFSQSTRGGEVRLVDYYEGSGEGFPFYVKMLREKGYSYGKHWAPHDIAVRELGTGKSRLETAKGLGLDFEITPRIRKTGDEVEDGIHAVRMLLPRCWFDEERCKVGLEALGHYRRDYNERLGEFKAVPVHDWSSHGADAFRGLAVRHQVPQEEKRQRRRASVSREWGWT